MTAASDIKGKKSSCLHMEMHVGARTLTVTSINQIVIQTDEKFNVEPEPQSPLGAQNQNQLKTGCGHKELLQNCFHF